MGTSRAPATGSILVYIRAEDGRPYSGIPQINLIVEESTQNLVQTPRMTGNAWAFSGLATGMSYEVEVKADGYQVARQTVLIPDIDGGSASVMIFLRPLDSRLNFHPPGGHFLLAPRAQKEVEKGLKDINSGKISSAQKHFQKALAMAPGNPYVNYVMGMSYLLAKQLANARPYLEKSVSVDPSQAPSLLALGTLRFDQGDYPGAIQVLSKAVQLDPSSWKSDWMLSASYLKQRDYKQARDHALAALKESKGKASEVELLLAQALADLGDRDGALKAVQSFLNAHPNGAPQIRAWANELQKAPPVAQKLTVMNVAEHSTTTTAPAEPVRTIATVIPPPKTELPPEKDWAPPDIDEAKHFVIPEAACSLPKVLKAARKSAVQFVDTLQKFTATEEYQSVEVKRNKSLERPESQTYSYLATIESPRSGTIPVTEYRDQSASEEQMPGRLNDIGAPALALVFHPVYQDDFKWSCEGLSEWDGKTAWIIRFEQRPDRPATLAALQASSGTYLLPFKGLAWVGSSGHVIHAEFDLVKPIKQADLYREHFSLDYKPVTFKGHKVTLWLPEDVNIYYQYRGHYLHHYHHFSDFQLFWTGASQKVGTPVEAGVKKSD
ncbi:MAG TPA: tetratricopeptide repeat protein [Verrucomicrobiae bacterium]|nr:tetratricopeptide repeat protein [Verrucomicrobiae bacterium]